MRPVRYLARHRAEALSAVGLTVVEVGVFIWSTVVGVIMLGVILTFAGWLATDQ